MTPIEVGFIALVVVAFSVFMATLLTVTWLVEHDAPKVPTKSVHTAQWPADGKKAEAPLRRAS